MKSTLSWLVVWACAVGGIGKSVSAQLTPELTLTRLACGTNADTDVVCGSLTRTPTTA